MGQERAKTYFIDLDGVIFKHRGSSYVQWNDPNLTVDERMIGFFEACEKRGDQIIIVSARPECLRSATVMQLRKCGLWWHQLILGVTNGHRVIINDPPGCTAFPVDRNHADYWDSISRWACNTSTE